MWNVRDAKSRFSELLTLAQSEPQTITNRGQVQAVVVNAKKFEMMTKDLRELRKLLKKQNTLKLQNEIQLAFEEAGVDEIDFKNTPSRPLPEFK